MKVFMLITGSGPLVIMTSHASLDEPALQEKLAAKGVFKFVSYEIPESLAKERYGVHFNLVAQNLDESDDLRVLDYNGERAFRLFRFDELGTPQTREPDVYLDAD